jgi:hypothetical protein
VRDVIFIPDSLVQLQYPFDTSPLGFSAGLKMPVEPTLMSLDSRARPRKWLQEEGRE